MRKTVTALAWICAPLPCAAQTVSLPSLSSGDMWTFQSTVENRSGWHQGRNDLTVVRADASSIATENKPSGSSQPPREQLSGADWSRTRSVNGEQTVVNRPLSFPLRSGKTWSVEYTESNPNRSHSSEHFRSTYKVVGWEDVTVPAGTFHALKIEADGDWTAVMAPSVSAGSGARVDAQGTTSVVQTSRVGGAIVSGKIYRAFWYVPSVKRWVKSLEEYFDANGVRTERYLDELTGYHVGG